MKSIFLHFFICFSIAIFSQETKTVANIDEYKSAIKKAVPGSKIVLKNGVWKDVALEAFY